MKRPRAITEKPALDLIEETIALLRRCPPHVAALYYVGTLPFVLGFLYFWADMSRSAFAEEHIVESSLWVALGFLWCKGWQALFATHLLAVASGQPLPALTWRTCWRVAATQAPIQASGLVILPLAALITMPLGFAYAFYQNTAALALDASGHVLEGAELRREALAQARRWPFQNHVGLGVLSFFGLVVFVNILIVIFAVPWLLKTLFGVETMFTRAIWSMFNTTLLTAAIGIAYFCVDPICKAFYVLRCFHGRSLTTGEDLRVQWRASVGPGLPALMTALVLFFSTALAPGEPATSATPGPDTGARAAQIDRGVAEVLTRPEFAWREPREVVREQDEGALGHFFLAAERMFAGWLRPLKQWAREFFRWLAEHMNHRQPDEPAGRSDGWQTPLRLFAWMFCGVAVCALAVLGWRLWQRRGQPMAVAAAPARLLPDLTAEDVAADELPEDAWRAIAREMIARRELRLAMRALYLAMLAHLGARQLISITRSKSNSEYQSELRRRRPLQADLNATFGQAVAAFERIWYGCHEVSGELLDDSQANLDKIRQCEPTAPG